VQQPLDVVWCVHLPRAAFAQAVAFRLALLLCGLCFLLPRVVPQQQPDVAGGGFPKHSPCSDKIIIKSKGVVGEQRREGAGGKESKALGRRQLEQSTVSK